MFILKFYLSLGLSLIVLTNTGRVHAQFKTKQLSYSNVQKAYSTVQKHVDSTLKKHALQHEELQLYIQVFKLEKKVEVWAKNERDTALVIIDSFKICFSSGQMGAKRRRHDLQVPEGFYHINSFNPKSTNYLALGINYPNPSDRILGEKGNLGGNIALHGGCISVGCVPISDVGMSKLYIYCIEARNNGQIKIPVTIYPAEMTKDRHQQFLADWFFNQVHYGLWSDLRTAYKLFRETKEIPQVIFLKNGRHKITTSHKSG